MSKQIFNLKVELIYKESEIKIIFHRSSLSSGTLKNNRALKDPTAPNHTMLPAVTNDHQASLSSEDSIKKIEAVAAETESLLSQDNDCNV